MKSFTLIIFLNLVFISCQQEKVDKEKLASEETTTIQVFNFDKKSDRTAYQKLDLDKTHPNLLNPQISDVALTEVRSSWNKLHQDIGAYLNAKGFSWEVPDSTITIVQKFYFTPEGNIKSYFFNIRNENVAAAKKEAFGKLVSEFAKENTIQITREAAFAQCGKTRYINQ